MIIIIIIQCLRSGNSESPTMLGITKMANFFSEH